MAGLNLGRVVLGGLLAGLVLNIGEYGLNEVVLKAEWDAVLARDGSEAYTLGQSAGFIAIIFAAGIVTVWLYAAMRPRFGAGPKTAVIAGLTVWLLAWALLTLSVFMTGLISAGITATTIVWGFFEVPIATLAGAWLYRE